MANWQPADFTVAVQGDKIVTGTAPEGKAAKQVQEADKKILQSNGPIKTYYKHAAVVRLPEFGRS